jgi:tetratricopeptide (TPR) repeat protein
MSQSQETGNATAPPRAVPGNARTSRTPASRSSHWSWFTIAIFGAVFLAYFPALRAGFVWDDDAHVTRAALRSFPGLWRIWSDLSSTQQYYPLLHSAFWLEHRMWGDNPLGYHVLNLVLHGIVAILFARVLQRLAIPGAWLAAFIFALHPVHVESVAWITEQKNTLSTIFYLCAMLAYLRFDSDRRWSSYAAAFAFFVCGLLTKTVIATLPAALLVILWWQRGRLHWSRDGRPLLPWFVLAIIAGVFTAWVERTLIGADGAAFDLPLAQRFILAGRAPWFYVAKLLWPQNLTFIYPRWILDASAILQWLPLTCAAVFATILWQGRHRSRAPLAASLLFAGSLFPVLGFLNVYPFIYSFVADHFQYLPSLGLIAFAAAGLASLRNRWRIAGSAIIAAILVSLAASTWQQSKFYHDQVTLFRATLARNPDCWMAHNNLGKELLADKATQSDAIASFERALALRPNYAEAHNNLGLALTQNGRPLEAIPHLEQSLRLKPRVFQAHNNLGIAYASSGRPLDAVRAFEEAARLNPNLPNLHENWAKALLLLGRRSEADEHFAIAARLRQGQPLTPSPPTSRPTPR